VFQPFTFKDCEWRHVKIWVYVLAESLDNFPFHYFTMGHCTCVHVHMHVRTYVCFVCVCVWEGGYSAQHLRLDAPVSSSTKQFLKEDWTDNSINRNKQCGFKMNNKTENEWWVSYQINISKTYVTDKFYRQHSKNPLNSDFSWCKTISTTLPYCHKIRE
jgi:hypothetical protein